MNGFKEYVCPRCLGVLQHVGSSLNCAPCALNYPLIDGIPYLAFYGEDWYLKLREVLLYRIQLQKYKGEQVERDRIRGYEEHGALSVHNLGISFEHACQQIDFSTSPRILDAGAGGGEVAQRLAEKGAHVWAAEMNLFELHYDPRWMAFTDLHGRSYYEMLRGIPITLPAFQRVISDIDYLPFADGFFDYVVCRAVAHHLHDLPRFFREANRVLKPGGKILLLSEPLASVLDRPERYKQGDIDYEEGLNENRPNFSSYARALKQTGFGKIAAQCYHIGYGFRGNYWMNRLRIPGDLNAWLSFRVVREPYTWLLNFTAGSVDLSAQKVKNKAPSRTPINEKLPARSMADLLAEIHHDPSATKQVMREFLPRESMHDSIDLAAPEIDRIAARGFRAVETIACEPARYLLNPFYAYLRAENKSTRLKMKYCADALNGVVPRVRLNGQDTVTLFETGGWKITELPLPNVAASEVIELEIAQPELVAIDRSTLTDARDIGLALQRIWLE